MLQIGIVDINRTPSIMDKIDEVAQIVNKKTEDMEEIEYQSFKKRNQSLINNFDTNDDTLLDGLDDKY